MPKKKILKTSYGIILLLVMIFLVIGMFFRFSYVTRNKENAWMWDNFNALPKNSVTALFVGNSHSFCSINTDMLTEVYGYSSFMLSSSGQTMEMNYYAILEALKTQKPSTIYLEASYMIHDWKHAGYEMAHMFFDGMPLDSIKIAAVKDLIEDEDERIYFYLPLGQYHSRFSTLTEYDYASDLTAPNGRFYSESTDGSWPFPIVDINDKKKPSEVALSYLDKIVNLCKEQNIELILYTVPFSSMYDDTDTKNDLLEYQRVYNYLYDYAEEKNIKYFNLFHEYENIGLNYRTDFLDSQHFNCYGQDTFTVYMIDQGYINME